MQQDTDDCSGRITAKCLCWNPLFNVCRRDSAIDDEAD